MYDDAWMPHMQRITWNGIALHGGPLPGHAASHGCVRLPFGFAERLFEKTRIGMRVIIAPNDTTPVPFSHPALLVPNAEALAAARVRAEPLAREAAEAARADDEAKRAATIAAREAATLTALLRKLELSKRRADAELASADKALIGARADQTKLQSEGLKRRAAELGKQFDAVSAEAKQRLDASNSAKDAAEAAEIKKADTARAADQANLSLEPVSIYISRATQKLYVRRATRKPVRDGGEVFEASIEVPVKIRNPGKPIGTHVFTAMAREGAGLRWSAVTIDDGDDAAARLTASRSRAKCSTASRRPHSRSSIIVSDEPLSPKPTIAQSSSRSSATTPRVASPPAIELAISSLLTIIFGAERGYELVGGVRGISE